MAGLVAATAGINRALTDYHQYPQQSLFIFDLAGVAVRSGRADLLDAAAGRLPRVLRGRDSIALDALRAHYYPSTWTPLALEAGSPLAMTDSATEVDALAAAWVRALREQPMAYLRHRAAVFRQVIGAHREPLFAPVYFAIPESSPDHAMVSRNFRIDTDVSPLQWRLRSAFATLATWTLYRPWPWLGLNLLVVAAAVWARRPAVAAIALSGLCYELALFFLAPSADYRYSHWLILATWAALAALAAQWLRNRRVESVRSRAPRRSKYPMAGSREVAGEPGERPGGHGQRRSFAAEPGAQHQGRVHTEVERTAHAVGGEKPQPLPSGGGRSGGRGAVVEGIAAVQRPGGGGGGQEGAGASPQQARAGGEQQLEHRHIDREADAADRGEAQQLPHHGRGGGMAR